MIESNTETKYQFCFYFNLFFIRIEHKTLRFMILLAGRTYINTPRLLQTGNAALEKKKKRKGIN